MKENSCCLEILSLLLPQRVPDVSLAALDLPLDKVEQDVLIDLELKIYEYYKPINTTKNIIGCLLLLVVISLY